MFYYKTFSNQKNILTILTNIVEVFQKNKTCFIAFSEKMIKVILFQNIGEVNTKSYFCELTLNFTHNSKCSFGVIYIEMSP